MNNQATTKATGNAKLDADALMAALGEAIVGKPLVRPTKENSDA